MRRMTGLILGLLGGACAGAESSGDASSALQGAWTAQTTHTLRLGANDNAEVVRVIPGQAAAVVVSSKARKLTRVAVGDALRITREVALFADDPSESELTSIDVSSDGTWAAVTRTLITVDGDGKQVACGGALVLVDVTDSDAFGTVLQSVTVGPMPDAVDISDDDKRIAVANERDGPDAWGKCEVVGAMPSVSIVDVADGPAAARETHRMEVVDSADSGPREPESIRFAPDGDRVVVTLQDSHEVLLLKVSDLDARPDAGMTDAVIVRLPNDALGAGPWPDGVGRFVDGAGALCFVTAGEWNDTFSVLDRDGAVLSTTTLSARDLPAALPRVIDEGSPLFSPDTVASFVTGGRVYLAFTLRHAGAVAVYDATDAAAPRYVTAVPVGADEAGKSDKEGSTVRPEGIDAAPDGSFLIVANEGESSVSLIRPITP